MDNRKVMIQKRFRHKVDELKGLIKEKVWSAPSGMLVAVSGGMDSMCMAHLFHETFGASEFAIAHCNFNLRGEESDGDEQLVRKWAEERGIRCHSVSFETEIYAQNHGLSIEMAARELRYRWFAELCAAYGYSSVAVAHHAEDNAETLILNMVRGAGLKGMTGMKAVSDIPCQSSTVQAMLMRPMLEFSRKQIEGYVLRYKIPYRTDSSNMSVEYRRNRIRHEVFPVLRKLNPSFVATFNREMAYLSDASEIVDQWCRDAVEKVAVYSGQQDEVRISIKNLRSFRQWRYLLYHILEPYGFNSAVLSSLEDLLDSDRTVSGKRFLYDSYQLVTEREELVVSKLEKIEEQPAELIVEKPGIYSFNGVTFGVEVCPWTQDMPLKQQDGVQIFDASQLRFPIVFRRWKTGDWMIPLGMRGKKKISDVFTDMKYDSARKKKAVILVGNQDSSSDNQRVAALLWVRTDLSCKVGDRTETIIRINRL